jgi:hypothetical protein
MARFIEDLTSSRSTLLATVLARVGQAAQAEVARAPWVGRTSPVGKINGN